MAKKTRAHKSKEPIKILAIIFSVLIFAYIAVALMGQIGAVVNTKFASNVAAAGTSALVPQIDPATGYATFTTDEPLKILVLSDIHIGGGFLCLRKDRWALQSVEKMVKGTNPDLVILTGDLAYPFPIQSGTCDNMVASKEIGTLMESLGVYWAVTLGNHDSEVYAYYDREQIADYYESLEHCLFVKGPEDVDGYGNYFINVKNTAGVITQALVLMDSHSYKKGFLRDYDNIHQNQVDWYEREINRLKAQNAEKGVDKLDSLAFFHIPLTEYKTAYLEYVAAGKQDTANVKYNYGVYGESESIEYVSCGTGEDEMFEKMLELGSTKAVFVGHDHDNNGSFAYNGGSGDKYIDLNYVMSIDYLAYFGIWKRSYQRGGTLITVNPDGSFEYGLKPIDEV